MVMVMLMPGPLFHRHGLHCIVFIPCSPVLLEVSEVAPQDRSSARDAVPSTATLQHPFSTHTHTFTCLRC